MDILTFFWKVRINIKYPTNPVNPVLILYVKIGSIPLYILCHSVKNPWLTSFFTMAGSRICVAKQAIVVAGLQAVGTDVGRYLTAAAGLYPLAGVFSEG